MENKIDLNLKDSEGMTALMMAIDIESLKIVKELLKNQNNLPERKIDVNLENDEGMTALMMTLEKALQIEDEEDIVQEHNQKRARYERYRYEVRKKWARINKNQEIIQEILKTKPNVNTISKDGSSALHLACELGDVTIVQTMIHSGADVHNLPDLGTTCLHIAVKNNHFELADYLIITEKVDLNAHHSNIMTPLFEAIGEKNKDMVEFLLERGAKMDPLSQFGNYSGLHLASINGFVEIMDLLIHCGAEIDLLNQKFGTPIYQATFHGNLEAVLYLIQKKATVNLSGSDGNTPLMIAVEKNYVEIVKVLLNAKNDINLNVSKKRADGHSAISLAELLPNDSPIVHFFNPKLSLEEELDIEASLEKLTLKELKSECKNKELGESGNKEKLKNRLKKFHMQEMVQKKKDECIV
jgi:hypothetical protein